MSKGKKHNKRPTPERPGPIRWKFGPNIPTRDFFEGIELDDVFAVEEAVVNFLDDMKSGTFLTWEAVVCDEQDLPLTRQQKAALSELINFGDPDDDQILAIDEIPRTSEPWYDRLVKLDALSKFQLAECAWDGYDDTRKSARRLIRERRGDAA